MRAPRPVRSRSSSAARIRATIVSAPARSAKGRGGECGAVAASVAAQRAVDRSLRHVVGPDAQARGDARPKAFEDDVGAGAQRPAELRLGLQVADDRLLAGVQACVPVRGHVAHRVAVRRLEPHDPGAEPEELAARERAGQIPGQVDDEQAFERAILHGFGS